MTVATTVPGLLPLLWETRGGDGKTYYFCSKSCKTKSDANPAQYAK